MGQAIPRQQPAVVLRSQFNQLRALLAIALVAVAGLTVAVVIVSNDAGEVAGTSSAKPIESINFGDSRYVHPSTATPASHSRGWSTRRRAASMAPATTAAPRKAPAASAPPRRRA